MRGLRVKYYIFSLLAILSIVSIGFASWSIDGLENEFLKTIKGSLEVDDVIVGSNYLKLKTNPDVFRYGERGFVNSNNEYIQSSSITLCYELDLLMCKTIYDDLNSLYITLSIEYAESLLFKNGKSLFENFNIVDNDSNLSYNQTLNIFINDSLFLGNITIDKTKMNISFRIIDYFDALNLDKVEINIKYQWTLKDNIDYFKNNIFSIIYDLNNNTNKLSFLYNASITGN